MIELIIFFNEMTLVERCHQTYNFVLQTKDVLLVSLHWLRNDETPTCSLELFTFIPLCLHNNPLSYTPITVST